MPAQELTKTDEEKMVDLDVSVLMWLIVSLT